MLIIRPRLAAMALFYLIAVSASWIRPSNPCFAQASRSEIIQFEPYHGHGVRTHCAGFNYLHDVQPWLAQCERLIRRAGFEQQTFNGKTIKIRISVDNGIGTLKLAQNSGSPAVDQAALNLVKAASPFETPEIGLPANRPLLLLLKYPRLELKFFPPETRVHMPSWAMDPYLPSVK
jgi:hypothetical protein